jgi:hypothetical protein
VITQLNAYAGTGPFMTVNMAVSEKIILETNFDLSTLVYRRFQ